MDLTAKIQRLLAAPDYHPLRRAELAARLELRGAERREFRRVLADLLARGEVVRVRHDRFVLAREADLVSGRISFSEKGFAFVTPDPAGDEPATAGADLFVGEEDTGTALHGDRVLVRLQREGRPRFADQKPAARVIRIVERANPTIVGTLQQSRSFLYVVPDEPRFTHDIYTQPGLGAKVGDKVVVRLAEWASRHVNPEGDIVEVLGPAEAPGVDLLALIRKHHLPARFTEPTLAAAAAIPAATDPAALAGRLDLRARFVVTIDPDDAKDFDDAVEVEELPGGGWRLGVHIADVSHYLAPGTALDREAFGRGNSVYLVDRVIPMLPERLSNDLCSLRPDEDRLTFSCLLDYGPDLKVRHTRFASSVIRSRHRLTYKQVAALLGRSPSPEGAAPSAPSTGSAVTTSALSPHEDCRAVADRRRGTAALRATEDAPPGPGPDELPALLGHLRTMNGLAVRLRAQRFAHGALDLDFPEVKVRLDAQGRPIRLEKVEHDFSHQLVEEFMLAANEAVARHLAHLQVPAIYRIHESPTTDKLDDFRAYAQTFGLKVGDVHHRQELQKLLAIVADRPEKYAIHLALLRSLKQARYAPQPVGHYGLATKFYTHFTSPIRRYADLVVHRLLRATLDQAFGPETLAQRGSRRIAPYSLDELGRIAGHVSQTERIAAAAEQESVELKKLEYFQQQLTGDRHEEFDAVVCGVRNFGFFVELPESLVQGLVHVSALEDDFYAYDQSRERLVGRRTQRIITIGDKLRVTVARVDLFKRQIDFRVVLQAPVAALVPKRRKSSRRR